VAWIYTFSEVTAALSAVEKITEYDGLYPNSKREFAIEMGWRTSKGRPDVKKVERVCNLTRDQGEAPDHVRELLAGAVIAYAPTRGGMTCWIPTAQAHPQHWVHSFEGDLQRQQQYRTENRRRLEDWRAFADAAWLEKDEELLRLVIEARHETDRSGFVSETTNGNLFKCFRSRGWL
jgi:hypothetical protein